MPKKTNGVPRDLDAIIAELAEIADNLSTVSVKLGAQMDEVKRLLLPEEVAPPEKKKVTKGEIRIFAAMNPEMNYRDMAGHFGVPVARVTEALRGKQS